MTSIFALNEAQLLPIVESIAGEPVASFTAAVTHEVEGEHYGFNADKLIPTFAYTTVSGRYGETTVFVKQAHEPVAIPESVHYATLATIGAPIPVCHGALSSPQAGRGEVIFLEHVLPVPDYRPYERFGDDENKLRQFLAVTAHLDALVLPQDYANKLPIWSPHELYGGSTDVCLAWFDTLWEDARSGALGTDLAGLCTDRALERLRRLPERVADLEFPSPVHVWHDCYEPCHTGWRRGSGEMVVFDLQPMGLGPRFANIAGWLGQPDEVQPLCRPARELAEFYLAEYVKHGGDPVPLDQFLAETRAQWLCEAMSLLDRWRRSILAGEQVYRGLLFRLVRLLLREVG